MAESLIEKLNISHGFYEIKTGFRRIEFHKVERMFSQVQKQYVKDKWDALIRDGKVKFSSELIALFPEFTKIENEVLHVTGYKTDYKNYRATLDHPNYRVWLTGPSAMTRLMGYDDPFYIVGERIPKANTQIGGNLEFVPGGYLDAKHFESENPFIETLYKELHEETGITKSNVKSAIPFWTGQLRKHFGSDNLSQDVSVDFFMNIDGLSREDVYERFSSLEKKEHKELHFVPQSKLMDYANSNWERFNLRGRCSLALLFSSYKND